MIPPYDVVSREEIIRLHVEEGMSVDALRKHESTKNIYYKNKNCHLSRRQIIDILGDNYRFMKNFTRTEDYDMDAIISLYRETGSVKKMFKHPCTKNLVSGIYPNTNTISTLLNMAGIVTNMVQVDKDEIIRLHVEEKVPVFQIQKMDVAINKKTGNRLTIDSIKRILGDKLIPKLKMTSTSYVDMELLEHLHVNKGYSATHISKKKIFVNPLTGDSLGVGTIIRLLGDKYIFTKKESTLEKVTQFYLQGQNYKKRDRSLISPLELDFLIEDKKLAIELNGCYWHSDDLIEDKFYHQKKFKQVKDKGYSLLQFREDEILFDEEKCFSLVNNKLGLSSPIMARKCKIVVVDKATEKRFNETNHLQNHCYSKVAYGLEYKGKLVMMASFGHSRFDKKYQWEIYRISTLIGHHVVGGMSKLIKHFIKTVKPDNIISYCDLTKGDGSSYEKCGFEYIRTTEPNYVWVMKTYTKNVLPRYKTQKHKLKKLLPDYYSDDKSESQIMKEAGYFRIYDAGNAVYTWQNPNTVL